MFEHLTTTAAHHGVVVDQQDGNFCPHYQNPSGIVEGIGNALMPSSHNTSIKAPPPLPLDTQPEAGAS
ncbi:MAG: hypothetical protein M3329_00150 [Pseudomonadota bacterium]|nr:hypothetical protein [Pseudomonadota bacterium]